MATTLLQRHSSIFVHLASDRDQFNSFSHSCNSIMSNNQDPVNYISFNNSLNNLLIYDLSSVDKIVFKVVNNRTIDFKNEINNKIHQGLFTVECFRQMYDTFYSQSELLVSLLTKYNKLERHNIPKWLMKDISSQRLMSGIQMMFYCNVLRNTYDYEEEKLSLYNLLGRLIKQDTPNINLILSVFKMYRFFTETSFSISSKLVMEESLFDNDNDNNVPEDLLDLGTNKMFVLSLIELISNNIKTIIKNPDDLNTKTNITDIITVSTYFKDRIMFNLYYDKYLEKRLNELLNTKTTSFNTNHTNTEIEFLSYFKTPEDNREVQQMLYKIQDTEENIEHNFMYKHIKVNIESEKYKKQSKTLDVNKIDIVAVRQSCWTDTNNTNYSDYNLPIEMEPYVDIFSKYYSNKYPYRSLRFNFNNSIGVVSLSIKGKSYQVQLTTSQMILIFQFNQQEKLSGYELIEKMGITIAELSPLLNSMLLSKILTRTPGRPDDPNLKFYINPQFTAPSTKVSLVNNLKKMMVSGNKKTKDKEPEQTGQDNIIKSIMVHVVTSTSGIESQDLITQIKKQIPEYICKDLTDDKFISLLNKEVEDKVFKEVVNVKQNQRYYFLEKKNIETTSDSEDSDE